MDDLLKVFKSLLVIVLLLGIGFFIGYKKVDRTSLDDTSVYSDTVYKYDTITKFINNDIYQYKETIDTIYYPDSIPSDIDTLAILKDYYSKNKITREWSDTNLYVKLVDEISQNKIVNSNWLEYKILKPQTIVTNTEVVHKYSSYLNINYSSSIQDLSYSTISLVYIRKKFSFGIGYIPLKQTPTISFGYNLIKMK